MALPQIYKTPTFDVSNRFTRMGQVYDPSVTSLEQAKKLKEQGYSFEYSPEQQQWWRYNNPNLSTKTGGAGTSEEWQAAGFKGMYGRAYDPQYKQMQKFFGGADPATAGAVWQRGQSELDLNVDTWKKEIERSKRRYQEAVNWFKNTGVDPDSPQGAEKLAELEKWAENTNSLTQQLSKRFKDAFGEDIPLEYAGEAGFQDVSEMEGGTPGADLTTEEVEARRAEQAAQGAPPTTPEGAPPATTPEGTPTTPPTAGYVYGEDVLDKKANDAAVNHLYQQYFGRDASAAELANWGAQGGADTTVRSLEDFLKSEQQKYGVGMQGAPTPVSGEVMPKGAAGAPSMTGTDLTGLATGPTAPGTMGEFLAQQQQSTRDFYSQMLGTLGDQEKQFLQNYLDQPSMVDELKRIREEQGLPQLEKEVELIDKQILDTEGLMDNLEKDITERTKGFPVSESARRRMLALEGKPLSEQLNQLIRGRTRLATGLSSKESVVQQILAATQEERARELHAEELKLGWGKEKLGKLETMFSNEQAQQFEAFKAFQEQQFKAIEAAQPDINVRQFTDEFGDVTLMGIDKKTGEKMWYQEVGQVGATQKWTTEDERFDNTSVDIDNSEIPQELLSNCVKFARWVVPDMPMVGLSETDHTVNANGKRAIINSQTPTAGAVAVMPEVGFYGHLGIIESTNADGTVNLIETNYKTGQLSRRTGTPKELGIEGYYAGEQVRGQAQPSSEKLDKLLKNYPTDFKAYVKSIAGRTTIGLDSTSIGELYEQFKEMGSPYEETEEGDLF